MRELGAHVASLHAAGLAHGDMRGGNLLVRDAGARWEFCWLDTEGNREARRIPLRWRVKNLVQLNMLREGVSLRDRVRFWRAYRLACGMDPVRLRRLRRAVLARTNKRWAKRGWLQS